MSECCNPEDEDELFELINHLADLKATLAAAYKNRKVLVVQKHEQYSTNTGQTSLYVVNKRLTELRGEIEYIKREIADTKDAIANLEGRGGRFQIAIPIF